MKKGLLFLVVIIAIIISHTAYPPIINNQNIGNSINITQRKLITQEINPTNICNIYDDFNDLNTTIWEIRSNNPSYPYVENGELVLMGLTYNSYAQIWLKEEVYSDFTVRFRFYIGGGSGADGIVFMFYKSKDYEPEDGGYIWVLMVQAEIILDGAWR